MLKVFKVDDNNVVWESIVNNNGKIIKKVKRSDLTSPFTEIKIKKEVLKMETEVMNKTEEAVQRQEVKQKKVSARIKELIKEGKDDAEIISIVKSELANSQLTPVATPISVYLRDIRSKIRSGRIRI